MTDTIGKSKAMAKCKSLQQWSLGYDSVPNFQEFLFDEENESPYNSRMYSPVNLEAIINTIPTAAWTTRPDGYCDFINQVWLDYAGMTAEQAHGWGWAEAIHPDDRKNLLKEWQSCLASGMP